MNGIGNQPAVAVITLTLFVPCIAQFLIMKKERGLKMASAIALFIFPSFVFSVDYSQYAVDADMAAAIIVKRSVS